ncbi:MAG: hypothetical protein ACRECU_13545 [Methylocella sp.]
MKEDTLIEVDGKYHIFKLKFVRKVHAAKPDLDEVKPNREKVEPNREKVEDKLQNMIVSRKHPPTYKLKCVFNNPTARECMKVEMKRLSAPRTAVWTGEVCKR